MLTTAQLQAIKADIESRAAFVYGGSSFSNHLANTRLALLAQYYNEIALPVVDLWRPDLSINEVTNKIVMADFISLTVGKRDAWFAMSQADTIDATQALVRTNFISIFGAGTDTLTNVTAIAKRQATRLEALFVTAGVSSLYNYTLTESDILLAIRS